MGVQDPAPLSVAVLAPDRTALPPGLFLNGAAATFFVIAVWRGSERTNDLGSIMIVALCWFVVLLAWLFKLAAAVGARSLTRDAILRWVLAPSLFVLTAGLVFGGHALGLRFALSQRQLDLAADAAIAGDPPAAGWIGLYPVDGVSVEGQAVWFDIGGQLPIVRDPPATEADDSLVSYEPLQGRWWIVYEFID